MSISVQMPTAGDNHEILCNVELVVCTVIFGVCFPSRVFRLRKSHFTSANSGKILCNRGIWELQQVVAEALKSSTTSKLDLHNNDIGDQGAEAPLPERLRFCRRCRNGESSENMELPPQEIELLQRSSGLDRVIFPHSGSLGSWTFLEIWQEE